jgi:AraC-like DNA-binding protein
MESVETKKFDIAASFNSIEALKQALEHIRLTYDQKPKYYGPYTSRIKRQKIGDVIFAEMEADPCFGFRGKQGKSDLEPFICVTAQLRGSLRYSQNDVVIEVYPGDLYIWNAEIASDVDVLERLEVKTLMLPSKLISKAIIPDEFFICKNLSRTPLSRLIRNQLIDMHEISGIASEREMDVAIRSFGELLHCSFFGGEKILKNYNEIFDRSVIYIRDNIYDMDLSVYSISNFLNIKSRTIQRAFSERNTTVSSIIKNERLSEAARVLSREGAKNLSLTELAHIFSFYDLAHFSRAFKTCFGCSPSDFRIRFMDRMACR